MRKSVVKYERLKKHSIVDQGRRGRLLPSVF